MTTARYVPPEDPESADYWEAARQGALLIRRCEACGNAQLYPPGRCRRCHSARVHGERSVGRGTVYTYTVVRRAPSRAWLDAVPYVLALIDLEEGVRILANVIDVPVEAVAIGMPVTVRFVELDERVSLPVFAPPAA